MTKLFSNDTLRTLTGLVAALLIGSTFIVAAAGPAVAATQIHGVNFVAESNIVRG